MARSVDGWELDNGRLYPVNPDGSPLPLAPVPGPFVGTPIREVRFLPGADFRSAWRDAMVTEQRGAESDLIDSLLYAMRESWRGTRAALNHHACDHHWDAVKRGAAPAPSRVRRVREEWTVLRWPGADNPFLDEPEEPAPADPPRETWEEWERRCGFTEG